MHSAIIVQMVWLAFLFPEQRGDIHYQLCSWKCSETPVLQDGILPLHPPLRFLSAYGLGLSRQPLQPLLAYSDNYKPCPFLPGEGVAQPESQTGKPSPPAFPCHASRGSMPLCGAEPTERGAARIICLKGMIPSSWQRLNLS